MGNVVKGTLCEVIVGHVAHSRRFRVLPFVPSEDLRSSSSSGPPLLILLEEFKTGSGCSFCTLLGRIAAAHSTSRIPQFFSVGFWQSN